MSSRRGPCIVAGIFLAGVLFVNLVYVCYPTDNDLDEIGWMAANLSLSRPESVANANFPLGLPVLLRVTSPLLGGILNAALIWSALALTSVLLIVYRLALLLSSRPGAALFAQILTGVLVFRTATSEFSDSIATALLVGGLYLILTDPANRRKGLAAGTLIGAAFTFRYHYLTFAGLVPLAVLILDGPTKVRIRTALWLLGGFAAGSLPSVAFGAIAHGTLYYTGLSGHIVGQKIMGCVDWGDYVATYDVWPIWRLISERPGALAGHVARGAAGVIYRPPVLAFLLLAPAWMALMRRRGSREPFFLAVIALVYIGVAALPTLATDRAMLPADVLLGLLVAHAIHQLSRHLGLMHGWAKVPYLAAAVMVLANIPSSAEHIQTKRLAMAYNEQILSNLKRAGMTASSEVFTNWWNLYPLDDPGFVTFYNYGGWLLLDSRYARERPRPVATSVAEWKAFMKAHGLRYLVIGKTEATKCFFGTSLPPDDWQLVNWDGAFAILALK